MQHLSFSYILFWPTRYIVPLQLTLDNMKLHREIEKLKTAANESDHLKRGEFLTKTSY